jgi:hypothetical protein
MARVALLQSAECFGNSSYKHLAALRPVGQTRLFVVRSRPHPLPQAILSPVITKKLNLKFAGVVCCWGYYDSDHIVTVRCAGEVKHSPIDSRSAGNLALLAAVNVCLRRREPTRSARLHFNKAKRPAFVGDQINLDVNDGARSIPADRKGKICGYDAIAELEQIGGCELFTAAAKLEMRRCFARLLRMDWNFRWLHCRNVCSVRPGVQDRAQGIAQRSDAKGFVLAR